MSETRRRSVRSFVLRGGRVTRLQRRALDELSERYVIPPERAPIDPQALFEGRAIVVEIGFGAGTATAMIAEERPEYGYVGIEVFPAGIGKLLSEIDRRGIDNLLVIRDDAAIALDRFFPPATIAGVHLFFPDPWPKKRHHKRRIVQSGFLRLVVEKLVPGGYFYAVTDWPDYARSMLRLLTATPSLRNSAVGYCDPIPWRPETRFEAKARAAGRSIYELYFIKTV